VVVVVVSGTATGAGTGLLSRVFGLDLEDQNAEMRCMVKAGVLNNDCSGH
jgi:hypothetical protein